jgi:hypothetical protein
LLAALTLHHDRSLSLPAAQNPNTPVDALRQVLARFPRQVWGNLALMLALLERPALFDEFPSQGLSALLRLGVVSPERVNDLADHANWDVSREASLRLVAEPERYLALAARRSWALHAGLAENPHVPETALIEMAHAPEFYAPSPLVARPTMTPGLLRGLLGATNVSARRGALKHPRVDASLVSLLRRAGASWEPEKELDTIWTSRETLSEEEIACLRTLGPYGEALANRHQPPSQEALAELAKHPNPWQRVSAAFLLTDEDLLEGLLNDVQDIVRVALAENPRLPERFFQRYERSLDSRKYQPTEEELVALAKHPKLTSSLCTRLALCQYAVVRSTIAQHPVFPGKLREQLRALGASEDLRERGANAAPQGWEPFQETNEPFAHYLLAHHPHTPGPLLARIAKRISTASPKVDIAGTLEALLSHPNTPPDTLRSFLSFWHTETRACIAKNPACPDDILDELLTDEALLVRTAALAHPRASRKLIACLQRAGAGPGLEEGSIPARALRTRDVDRLIDLGPFARFLVLRSPGISPDVYEWVRPSGLVESRSRLISFWLLRDPRTPEQVLVDQMQYRDVEEERLLAAHPNAPQAQLSQFASSIDPMTRRAAAENPATPAADLWERWNDESRHIRFALAKRPDMPEETLRWLALEPSPRIRAAVAKNPSLPGPLWETLSADESPAVRKAARQNPSRDAALCSLWERAEAGDLALTREELGRLFALAPYGEMLVAQHPKAAPDWLAALARSEDKEIRRKSLANPSCPPETLAEALGDWRPWVRCTAAQNTHCPPNALVLCWRAGAARDLSSFEESQRPLSPEEARSLRTGGPFLRALLARSPLSPEEAEALAQDESSRVRRALAENAQISPALRAELARDLDPWVRCAALARSSFVGSLWGQGASDAHAAVRRVIARHPETPSRILEELARDKSPGVRRAVRRKRLRQEKQAQKRGDFS